MNVRPTEHARLADLFLAEHARTDDAGAAMARAMEALVAERAEGAGRVNRVIAEVEAAVGINLRDRADNPTDGRRVLAYWLIRRQGVKVGDFAAALGRERCGIHHKLKKFGAQLLESAELRARLAWAKSKLNERERKERAA